MNERRPYPFEVYNRPCCATYDTGDGNFVLVEMQENYTIIQYPRSWYLNQCQQWASENDFPEPEFFGGTPEGCLMFSPYEPWCGNIMGIPRDHK